MQKERLFGIFLTEELKAFTLEEVSSAFMVKEAFGVEEGLLGAVQAVSEVWGEDEPSLRSLLREESGVHVAEWPLCFSP